MISLQSWSRLISQGYRKQNGDRRETKGGEEGQFCASGELREAFGEKNTVPSKIKSLPVVICMKNVPVHADNMMMGNPKQEVLLAADWINKTPGCFCCVSFLHDFHKPISGAPLVYCM